MTIDPSISNAGVIVCSHVAAGEPILLAARGKPADPDDSGWQFMCNSGAAESINDCQIWTVKNVVDRDPTIQPFINSPADIMLVRTNADSEWKETDFQENQ